MRARLVTLKKLGTLYGVVEEMHSTELQRLTAAVGEAQQAIGAQRGVMCLALLDGRRALISGDCLGRLMAETAVESADRKRRRLEEIRLERQGLSDVARELYVASRLKNEQMKSIIGRAEERVANQERRRMQTVADDRFLARRQWMDSQRELKSK